MAGDIRDWTGRYCFDMFGGKKKEDGAARDGKKLKTIVSRTGRDGLREFPRRDGTVQFKDLFVS